MYRTLFENFKQNSGLVAKCEPVEQKSSRVLTAAGKVVLYSLDFALYVAYSD